MEVTTLISFVKSLDLDAFFMRDADQDGPFFYSLRDAISNVDTTEPHWTRVVRVLWNEEHSIALVSKAIDYNMQPDRTPMRVYSRAGMYGFMAK